ncbi:MAG: hypothetical protein LAT51_08145 [Flavobacteriaceae bacterium]|nr:hypothetical protein [Flavobacteriaceae bacterium]
MTDYEIIRLKQLMEEDTYFYTVEQFKRFLFYYRIKENRVLGAYLSMMNEHLYKKLISNTFRNLPEKLEDFEFNEIQLQTLKYRTEYAFKGVESMRQFADFFLENQEKVNVFPNQLFVHPFGCDIDSFIKKRAVELVINEKPKSKKEVFDIYNEHFNKKIFYTSLNHASYSNFIEKRNSEGKIIDGTFKRICRIANNNIKINAKTFLTKLKIHLTAYFNNEDVRLDVFKVIHKDSKLLLRLENDYIFYKIDDCEFKELTEEVIYTKTIDDLSRGVFNSSFTGLLNNCFDNLSIKYILKNPLDKYVLIIDNLSDTKMHKVFGDVYPLVSFEKRNGQPNAQKIILKKSKEIFYVPENVFVLGICDSVSFPKMNSHTRNIFNLNIISPDYDKIYCKNIGSIDVKKILQKINLRIEVILGRNYLIDHHNFKKVDNFEKLKHLFYFKIIPFLENESLGNKADIKNIVGSSFYDYNTINGKKYEYLKPLENWTESMFVEIIQNQ